ncbi:hypothetical protein IGI04_032320 [Brassica rapa subsp. trilocularis]|uniref:Uncharacterized protein n=1 Tax=Brassica rapa subsp. trilocularis TaxID=1813537 RepID=A0ABQ7LZI1_BRACM|nr:hypothetical protein IGI04_032320 [Brassica rapa subsp. trilocularis]
MSPMMRPMAVSARVAPAVNPVARRVVAIVAGTRIGLNMMKSGADTTNATAETAIVKPAKAKKTTEATEAIVTLLASHNGMRKENISRKIKLLYSNSTEVASPLLPEDLHTEEREAVVEVVMCMSNALRVRYWYEAPTTNKTQTERGTTGVEGMKTDRFRHSLGEREEMVLLHYTFQITLHSIWRERNDRRHGETPMVVGSFAKMIDRGIRYWCLMVSATDHRLYCNAG